MYRDYQYGLGDTLIRVVTGGARRFEVIGYGEFEQFLESENTNISIWMRRLNALFYDLDFSMPHSDSRVQLLHDLLDVSGKLLVALSRIDIDNHIVDEEAITIAMHEAKSMEVNRAQ